MDRLKDNNFKETLKRYKNLLCMDNLINIFTLAIATYVASKR